MPWHNRLPIAAGGSGIVAEQLNANGLPIAKAGTSVGVATFLGEQQHFAYIDAAGNVWDRWYDAAGTGWHIQLINPAGGFPGSNLGLAPAATTPTVWTYDQAEYQELHYTYYDTNTPLRLRDR